MKRTGVLPELLSPAGDFDCLVAAVNAGADAVYVGGKRFGARAFAQNFDLPELSRALTYCHLHGVKLYVTLNTLIYEKEMQDVLDYAQTLYEMGVDALIITDLGAISLIHAALPDFPLHASTQMSVHNSFGADTAASFGCERVVLARELSGENIRKTVLAAKPECEVFLHGALCVCHSGQCLFSSLVGGRSGNRGECAQPCRLPYNGTYPLSLSDLSLADHIRELIGSGVSSLKIEGRMKSPDYVYRVTSVYRRLLDENRDASRDEKQTLADAFSRGGFTDGYFRGDVFSKMTGVRSDADKAKTRSTEDKESVSLPVRLPLSGKAVLKIGEPASLTFESPDGSLSVSVCGATVEPAISSPLEKDAVVGRLSKTGATFFTVERMEVSLDEGCNLSVGALNALRREATDSLEKMIRAEREAVVMPTLPKLLLPKANDRTVACFLDPSAMPEAASSLFSEIVLPLWRLDEVPKERITANTAVSLPPVVTEGEIPEVEAMLENAKKKGILRVYAENIGGIALAQKKGMTVQGGFRLNVFNPYSYEVYRKLGVTGLTASPELTAREARRAADRQIVYGRIPLMLTERCFVKENFGCEKCGKAAFTDRKGIKFPIVREYRHRNLVLNGAVTYTADVQNETAGSGKVFWFTTETAGEILAVYEAYKKGTPPQKGMAFRRLGKRKTDPKA